MASKPRSRKFLARTHKGRACFSVPISVQDDLGIPRHGKRFLRLIVHSRTGHYEGTKQLKSGSEIYGRDINESGIKKNQPITVVALCPDRIAVTQKNGRQHWNYSTSDAAIEAAVAARARSQGFQMDSAVRRALEEHAMKRAKAHFVRLFDSVKRRGKPYDLCCTKKGSVLYVEVKGTQTEGTEILLTPNEVEFTKKHLGEMALFLVYNIGISKKNGRIVTTGGLTRVDLNWVIDQARLSALGYSYSIPEKPGE